MCDEQKTQLRLEIAHVLFMDIVGYSKLLIDEQSEALHELNQIVRNTEAARAAEAAGQLIFLPTGDGMALVFTGSVEEPVECALQISQKLCAQPSLPVRMGIHSGPVHHVADVNQRENIAGAGINIAQRLMDCGDAGHILLSKRLADDLEQYPRWRPHLHSLGECEVKHGARLHTVNLYTDEVGNPQVPEKFKIVGVAEKARPKSAIPKWALISAPVFILVAIAFGSFLFWQRGKLKTSVPTSVIQEKSIAVLPFVDLSQARDQEYFCDGISEEILDALAKIEGLRVVARTSSFSFKGKNANASEVGKKLNVENVLKGSLRREGNRIRISAQLVNARNGFHLWSQTYERELKGVFALQDEITRSIVDALKIKLAISLPTHEQRNTEAYDLYLRGEYEFRQAESSLTADAYDRADAFYRQALAGDPNFAEAAAELAGRRLSRQSSAAPLAPPELEEVKSLIDRALALAPNSPEAHFALGLFFYYGHRQYENALTEFNRTLELQPNDALARAYCASVYRRRGEWERSLADYQRAQELDPRDTIIAMNIGNTYLAWRVWEDAERAELRALAIDPHNAQAALFLLTSRLNATGDAGSARRALDGFPEGAKVSPTSRRRGLGDGGAIIGIWAYLDVIERHFTNAFQAFEKDVSNDDLAHLELLAGRAALRVLAGESDEANSTGEEAQPLLEARFRERPDDTFTMTRLPWVYLALGRNADALRLSTQAADTISIEKDALVGPYFQNGLAQIEAHAGAPEEAIKRLRHLLYIPAGEAVSIARLKIDPVWDPIRNRPDFQQLLSGPEQIGPGR